MFGFFGWRFLFAPVLFLWNVKSLRLDIETCKCTKQCKKKLAITSVSTTHILQKNVFWKIHRICKSYSQVIMCNLWWFSFCGRSGFIYIYISPIKIFKSKYLKNNLARDWNPVLTIGGWRRRGCCRYVKNLDNRKVQKCFKLENKELKVK